MKMNTSKWFGALLVVAGGGYVTWRFTPVGKKVLSQWLMKRWKKLAKKHAPQKTIEWDKVQQGLNTFDYQTLEWLVAYTRLDIIRDKNLSPEKEKKALDLIKKLKGKGIDSDEGIRQLTELLFGT